MQYNYFVDISSAFFMTFIIGMALHSMTSSILEWMNSNKTDVGEKTKRLISFDVIAKKLFTPSRIRKAIDYERRSKGLNDVSSSLESSFTTLTVIFGITPFTLNLLMSQFPTLGFIGNYIIFTAASSLISTIYNIPFSLYGNFRIEKEFGFNNMTFSTFFTDLIKNFVIFNAITLTEITILNQVFTRFGRLDAFNTVCLVAGFMLVGILMEFTYMNFIIRLFNRLEPLKNGKLKKKLGKLMNSYGYNLNSVVVMDGSRRSNHSNAFIGGIGRSKKIVLFDTLLKTMTDDEIIAILGHELAHGKLHHLLFNRIIRTATLLITTFLAIKLMYNTEMYHAFGFNWVNEDNVIMHSIIGFNLSLMIIGSISWIVQPLESYVSRRMEYAADKYSVRYTGKRKALMTALLKLSSENLSDAFPDRFYEMYYNSHPSLTSRLEAIKRVSTK